ncbi:MAG: lysophospholipid acyltransferase family protein [Opitutaceae bacterium]|nr:lysophospholipid acyltransferase family protein [Opitutaceae bacterium]MBP9913342.1 lysophospholipid acyltransferase family protein [Opitutaceae bacterium]
MLNTPPPSSSPPPQVQQISGWRRAVLWPLGLLIRLWIRTLRFDETPEDVRNFTKCDEPIAMVLWHNRLFLAAMIFLRYRRGKPMYALVSASSDGAWLDAFFSLIGLRTVRGSSHKLGREAVTALVDVLRQGYDVGITPDGPRGPIYELKPGALIVTRRTRTPILLIGADFESAWRLNKSWDRFYLPKPFSRVRMRCDYIPATDLADRDQAAARLQARLLELNPDRDRAPAPVRTPA